MPREAAHETAAAIATAGGARIVYGTATGTNTVTLDGETSDEPYPAIVTVTNGDRTALIESANGDLLILGPVTPAPTA